jgi:hypothetical protein
MAFITRTSNPRQIAFKDRCRSGAPHPVSRYATLKRR